MKVSDNRRLPFNHYRPQQLGLKIFLITIFNRLITIVLLVRGWQTPLARPLYLQGCSWPFWKVFYVCFEVLDFLFVCLFVCLFVMLYHKGFYVVCRCWIVQHLFWHFKYIYLYKSRFSICYIHLKYCKIWRASGSNTLVLHRWNVFR